MLKSGTPSLAMSCEKQIPPKLKRDRCPEGVSVSSNGVNEPEEQEAKRRKRLLEEKRPSLSTSVPVSSRYGTESENPSESRLGDTQEACVLLHDGMDEIKQECRRRATEEDLTAANRIEQAMAMLNSLTDGTNKKLEASKQYQVCATCGMKK